MDKNLIEKGVSLILKGLEVDSEDENFKDTPSRVARAYEEILGGISNTQEKVDEILATSFPSTSSHMVVSTKIRVFSFCPHHLLPVDYTISVGYIPSKDGSLLGISKLSRLADTLAKRPVLQEQLGEDITEYLMKLNGVVGAGCIVVGMHYCMIMRGAKQTESKTITSSIKGTLLTDPMARSEVTFLTQQ